MIFGNYYSNCPAEKKHQEVSPSAAKKVMVVNIVPCCVRH